MSMRQLNNLSDVYLEAVYGKAPSKKKDTSMVVTNADKKANTPAYQNLKKGVKGYKAADHMDEENKKADKDYDGDGKIESGKDEYFGSKDKAIKKAMGKKVKEEFSDWRADLVEMDLIEVVDDDSDKEDDDYGSDKKVKEKKVKNCVKVNPNVKIESVQEGKKKKKGHDCASKVKHEEVIIDDARVNKPEPNLKFKSQKYEEDLGIKDLKDYISSTYSGHYTSEQNNTQTLDLIQSVGDAESFCRSNAIKYLARYDKKGQAKRDILKAMHYCLLLYYFSGHTNNETPTRGYETF